MEQTYSQGAQSGTWEKESPLSRGECHFWCTIVTKFVQKSLVRDFVKGLVFPVCFTMFINCSMLLFNPFQRYVTFFENNIVIGFPYWRECFIPLNRDGVFVRMRSSVPSPRVGLSTSCSSDMSLTSHGERPWFETHKTPCSINYFYCFHCFVLFALFFTQWLANISIFLSHWHSHIKEYILFIY